MILTKMMTMRGRTIDHIFFTAASSPPVSQSLSA
jgi:hypothetical protein